MLLKPAVCSVAFILTLAWSQASGLWAQAPFLNPRKLGLSEGLPHQSINSIVQDQAGFVWIATNQGLCRYDGSQLEVLNLVPSDSSTAYTRLVNHLMVERRTGELWLSTNLGLHRLDPLSGRIASYQSGEPGGLRNQRCDFSYQDRQGQLWVGNYHGGLLQYLPETAGFEPVIWSEFLPAGSPPLPLGHDVIIGMAQGLEDESSYWLLTRAGLKLWKRKQGVLHFWPLPPPPPGVKELTAPRSLYRHNDDELLIGFWSPGLLRFQARTGKWEWLTEAQQGRQQLLLGSCYELIAAGEQEAWASFSNNTVAKLSWRGGFHIAAAWQGKIRGGQSYGVRLIDRDGNLWAGYSQGVDLYYPQAQQIEHHRLIPENDTFAYWPNGLAALPSGNLLALFGNAGGLYELGPTSGAFQAIPLPASSRAALYSNTNMIQTRSGDILLCTVNDLYRYDPVRCALHKLRPTAAWQGARFAQVREDNRGDLWLGTYNLGLFRYDRAAGAWRHYREEIERGGPNHSAWLWGFTEDQHGKIWLRGSTGYSVYYPERDSFANFPFREGAANNLASIRAFAPGRGGQLWALGSDYGLGLIDPSRPEAGIVRYLESSAAGAPAHYRQMTADGQGHLWLVSSQGLSRVDADNYAFTHYDQGSGLPGYDALLELHSMDNARLQLLPDGRFALQYRRGIALFHPDSLPQAHPLPRPYVQRVKVFEEPLALDSLGYLRRALELKAGSNYFSFEFSAIQFSAPEGTRFRYRLKGLEENWVDAGTRRYAAYTNVPGGRYMLQLMAANSNGEWNPEAYELQINLAKTLHEQLWFRLLIAAMLLGLGYGLYRWRIQQMRQRQREREEFAQRLADMEMNALRAQMNPHFIFNCLNSIDSFIIKNETHKASAYLNDFARLIRLMLQNSRNNLVSLQDELEALELYLQMEQLRFSRKFEYDIQVAAEIPMAATYIPPLLIQPYVENAIWHGLLHKQNGEAGKVLVLIKQYDAALHITITDNGVGRVKAAELKNRRKTAHKPAMGTQITAGRIELINQMYQTRASVSTFDLIDSEGQPAGTQVVLLIPI
jgi:ligand-binding sensor domain-containing protein